jgi:hypothetical protein
MRKAIVCGTTVELTVGDLAWLEETVSTSEIDEIFVITGETVTAQITAWALLTLIPLTEHLIARDAVGAIGENGFVVVFVENGVYSTVLTETELPADALVYIRNSPEEV